MTRHRESYLAGLAALRCARRADESTRFQQIVGNTPENYGDRMSKQISRISDDSMDALKMYTWPGNIRKLQNFMERAVVFTRGDVLELPPLPSLILTKREPVTLRESERHHILRALEETKWVVVVRSALRLVSACHGRP